MRLDRAIGALFLLARLAAQTGGDKPATVDGIVVDSITGAPVVRARVTLQGKSSDDVYRRYGATSGPDGKFAIGGMAAGSFSVEAGHVGYVAQGKFPRIQLKEGDSKAGVEVRLMPTGTIIGRVTDPDGDPVQGASVEARNAADPLASRMTDERGQFRLGGLTPGRYFVRAIGIGGGVIPRRPEIRTDGSAETHTAATWFPGVLTRAEATRVEVRPGAESASIEIRLLKTPFVRVSGRVVGMPGKLERGSAVIMVWQEDSGTGIPLKPDGSFEIWSLTPGDYRLQGEWSTASGKRMRTTGIDIQAGTANIDNIELRVIPDSNIAGRLEFDDEQAKQPSRKDGVDRLVNLVPVEDATGAVEGSQARVAGDNTFRLENVPAGKYRLMLGWDDAYVRSMSLGSTAIDGALLDLSNGSGGADLIVRLHAATASVTGVVQGLEGGSDDTMVVLTSREDGFPARSTPVSSDGSYSFQHLPLASFEIVAVHTIDFSPAGNTVPGFEKLMETVDLSAGGEVTKNLTVRMPE